ncbi:hypothetical protein CAEBREN_10163 [Caenorhabditis brenneri]|uniref:Uncharacterized protein n=1 Tax=Caenorhabditis brenneri TaxID=135651 RepID=G0P8I7_CAEBE|nr:hypothetical protein CAEBREN_10163 [Caenorhabditis brenneri]
MNSKNYAVLLFPLAIVFFIGLSCVVYLQPTNVDNFGRFSYYRNTNIKKITDPTLSDKKRIGIYENIIDALEEPNLIPNRYRRRPETQHIDCGRILKKDKDYIQTLTGANRIPLIENRLLSMSCPAIKERIHANHKNFKLLKSGGVAFARIVYSDYEFIEKQVQISWHPQNVFCFAVDKKSQRNFHVKMQKLGECVENIVVLPGIKSKKKTVFYQFFIATESYDSSGHNMNLGHKRCMEALLQFPDWSYMMHLQNNDVITKSVYELARIFELFGGANDVNIGREIDQRRVPGLKWDPKSMKLFRNESKIDQKVLNDPMKVVSGYVQSSWSRAAVEWLIEEVDITIAMNQFNQTFYACDEQLFPSLQVNKEYGMPGHYTYECMDQEFGYEQITRFTKWASGNINNCVTKTVRNGICLVGIKEFGAISRMPAIISNKVLYHKHFNDPGFKLNCTPAHQIWKYEDYL